MGALNRQHLFEAAVAPWAKGLFAFIRCHAPQDPEDIYQETLLAAWKGFDGFRGQSTIKTWLYGIARYKCLDAMRGKYRRQAVEEQGAEQEGRDAGFEQAAVTRMDLSAAMERLREAERTLLYLVYGQGFSLREAADILDVPEGTVRSRLHTLRRRLRAGMEEKP